MVTLVYKGPIPQTLSAGWPGPGTARAPPSDLPPRVSRSSHGMSPVRLCSLLRVRLLGCSGPQAKPDRPQVGRQGLGWTIFILFHYLGFLNRFLFRNKCKYIEKLQKHYKELVFPETLESCWRDTKSLSNTLLYISSNTVFSHITIKYNHKAQEIISDTLLPFHSQIPIRVHHYVPIIFYTAERFHPDSVLLFNDNSGI